MKKFLSKRYLYIFSVTSLTILSAWALTVVLLYSQNLLVRNKSWNYTKINNELISMGAVEFLTSRNSLAENILDLDLWYGFHELIYKSKVSPDSLEYHLRGKSNAALDIIFNKSKQQYEGVRFDSRDRRKSFYFISNNDGKFIDKRDIENLPLIAIEKRIILKNIEGVGLSIKVDENAITILNDVTMKPGYIGLRSMSNSGKLEKVKIKTSSGQNINLDFKNEQDFYFIFFIHFLVAGLLVLAVKYIYYSKADQFKDAMQNLMMLHLILVVILAIWYLADFKYLSHRSSSKLFQDNSTNKLSRIDTLGLIFENIFAKWYLVFDHQPLSISDLHIAGAPKVVIASGPIFCSKNNLGCSLVSQEKLQNYFKENKKNEVRILFAGTSQTIGAGATTLSDTFFVNIYNKISNRYKNKNVKMLNISVSGSNAEKIFDNYVEHYYKFRPQLLVVNFSNNDEYRFFSDRILKFTSSAKSTGSKIILIGEANDKQFHNSDRVDVKIEVLKKIAKIERLPFYSMHDYLNGKSIINSGWIWWDYVHLSNYGHKLVADWLTDKIDSEL